MTTKPNSFLAFLSTLFIFAFLAAAGFGYAYFSYLQPGPLPEPKVIMIERGMGVSAIAEKLQAEQVIDYAILMKAAARIKDSSLKAGEYEFAPHVSMADVMRKLEEGEVVDRKFTIREGLTSYQVVKRLNEVEELSGKITDIPPEGSLLPETYHYIRSDTKQAKLEQMQGAMNDVIIEACMFKIDQMWRWQAGAQKPSVESLPPCWPEPLTSIQDVITLASIVEMETGVAEERKRVAGVFINRLKKGMALQTDPTVIYALTKGKVKEDGKGPLGRRLLRKDLDVDDPYNTYKYPGLPPGPIANPGKASIEAVLNPEEHDYIYFVADGTGGHVFSKTLREHNNNVAKWRKIRRKQN